MAYHVVGEAREPGEEQGEGEGGPFDLGGSTLSLGL